MNNNNNNEQVRGFIEDQVSEAQAVKRAFATNDGRIALEFIKKTCLVGVQAYDPSMPMHHTVFRNGMQQVHIELDKKLSISIKDFEKELEKSQKKEEEYVV
jgi:hypothetical protein